jgi:hypothetical protein
VPPWIETSAAALRSPSARRLAEACQQIPPRQWWKAFAESYPKPLKTTSRPSAASVQDQLSNQAQRDSSEPREARRA